MKGRHLLPKTPLRPTEMDDEILLGCKSPDESNVDLRPVTQLGFQSKFTNEILQEANAHVKELVVKKRG